MNYRIQEMKVGVMVLTCIGLLIFFIFVISGLDIKKETVIYVTQLPYVGGLEVGTPVRMGGVMAGRITAIVFPDESTQQIKLILELNSETPIKSNSRAYLTSIGLLGEFYLEIDPGSQDGVILPPGSEIPSFDTGTFTKLSASMGDMAVLAETTLVRINHLLGTENQQYLSNILADINRITTDNSIHLSQLFKNLAIMSTEMINITSRLDSIFIKNDLVIRNMIIHLDSTLIESRNLLVQTQNSLKSLDNMVIANSPSYQLIMSSLERSTYNLEEFSRNIKERPWNLIRKTDIKPRQIPDKQENMNE